MNEFYDIEKLAIILEQMKIHELREIAAIMGVQAPSQLRSAEAKEKILEIASNKCAPYIRLQKAGRPRKSVGGERYRELLASCKSELDDMEGLPLQQTPPAFADGEVPAEGLLEIWPEGFGFLRGYPENAGPRYYVSQAIIRRLALRHGDLLRGVSKQRAGDDCPALQTIESVNGLAVKEIAHRIEFDRVASEYPSEELVFGGAYGEKVHACAPLAKGARGLLFSDDEAGYKAMFADIIAGVRANNPETTCIFALLCAMPEEISEIERSVDAEVVSTSFDRKAIETVRLMELMAAHVERLAESGKDVLMLIDDLDRLADVFDGIYTESSAGGRFDRLRKFFGCARKLSRGGSVTLVGRCSQARADLGRVLSGAVTWQVTLEDGQVSGRIKYAHCLAK